MLNAGTAWIAGSDAVTVDVDVPGARTTAPAAIPMLAPGEQARLRLGIRNTAGTAPGTAATGTVRVTGRGGTAASRRTPLTLGTPDYQPTDASLGTHQAPYWFSDAKFGIFIHWGVYSVPAWSPVGGSYAEWYWNSMQGTDDPVHAYHAQTYGEDFAYDDFIPMFTASRFNPQSWVELFRDAGAEYYVLTSKHHEGFALWDTKVSDRNAVRMGPHRDLVAELFAASRAHTPELHNGLYFSMPEWFNPDNPWMGHAPRNPYTLEPVPYTGYTAGKDFVKDYQAPQMLELIHGYDPDVIWCDIGGVNDSEHVLADYFNHAKNRGRPKDVTVNDRSGISPHDFTTPEYTTYNSTVVAKWEASRGLDPHSYGYNSATPDDRYMTAEEVVQTLVDIVSKNGNFLLDIGPKADGTIPAIMEQRLRETGRWLAVNGESVYGTTYWAQMAQLGDLRFSVKQGEAFYISLARRSRRQAGRPGAGADPQGQPGDDARLRPRAGLGIRRRHAHRAGAGGRAGERPVRVGVQGRLGPLKFRKEGRAAGRLPAARPFPLRPGPYEPSSISRSPASTCWMPPIAERLTVPARWAVMDASIFIASIVATVWPAETRSPSSTWRVTTPANGAATCRSSSGSAFSAGLTSVVMEVSRTDTGRSWPLRVASTVRKPRSSGSETASSSISSVTPGSMVTACSVSGSRP